MLSSMKKIALCLSGYFCNKSGDDLLSSNCIYDDVINKAHPNSIDIFIFSFDIVNKKNISLKYPNAKISIIEEQKNMMLD